MELTLELGKYPYTRRQDEVETLALHQGLDSQQVYYIPVPVTGNLSLVWRQEEGAWLLLPTCPPKLRTYEEMERIEEEARLWREVERETLHGADRETRE